jgi:hypothetical protein
MWQIPMQNMATYEAEHQELRKVASSAPDADHDEQQQNAIGSKGTSVGLGRKLSLAGQIFDGQETSRCGWTR